MEVHTGDNVDWRVISPVVAAKVKRVEYAGQKHIAAETRASARRTCAQCFRPHSRVAYCYANLLLHFKER